jgi:DNA repair exonuclease SbcCD ATPase subunit
MPALSRLRRRRDELQEQYDLLSEKIQRLRTAHAIEAGAAVRFQLEKQIDQAESERDVIEQQINALDEKLEQASSPESEGDVQAVGAAPEEGAIDQAYLTRLRQVLTTRLDAGELRTLCFDLGMDYDDLPGAGKASRARELVGYLARRDRIADLIRVGKRLRPDIPWPER